MDNLKNLMIYFISRFPQKLGRTKLIKAVYLLDCEWYKLHGTTFSGLRYTRDNNGPFDTDFYIAKEELCATGILKEFEYVYPGGKGYEFHLGEHASINEFDPLAMVIANDIVEELKDQDLNGFLKKAYSTPPMLHIQEYEEKRGQKCYGEELSMDELRNPPKPLFKLDQIKEAARKLDLSKRGTDEEYAAVVNEEIEQLRLYRERVAEAWKLIQ